MKKLFLALAVATSILTACSDDSDEIVKTPVVGEITGTISSNITYAYGNYTLKGMVKIASGVTVTIEKGSTITADKANGENGLIILNGGKLIAIGTSDEPIVFTEKSKTSLKTHDNH